MGPSIFSQMGVHIPVTPFFLFLVLVLLMTVWAGFTWIIHYHWKNYGTSTIERLGMNLIYFIGSGILICGMAVFAFLYNFSS